MIKLSFAKPVKRAGGTRDAHSPEARGRWRPQPWSSRCTRRWPVAPRPRRRSRRCRGELRCADRLWPLAARSALPRKCPALGALPHTRSPNDWRGGERGLDEHGETLPEQNGSPSSAPLPARASPWKARRAMRRRRPLTHPDSPPSPRPAQPGRVRGPCHEGRDQPRPGELHLPLHGRLAGPQPERARHHPGRRSRDAVRGRGGTRAPKRMRFSAYHPPPPHFALIIIVFIPFPYRLPRFSPQFRPSVRLRHCCRHSPLLTHGHTHTPHPSPPD